jgi:hypothetical protein
MSSACVSRTAATSADRGWACNSSSELHIAEHFYAQSALIDLLGIAPEKINEQRLEWHLNFCK